MAKKPNKKTFTIIIFSFLILLFLHFTTILSPVESFLIQKTNSVSSQFYNWGNNLNNKYFNSKDKKYLQEENKKLQGQVNRLIAENSKLRQLEEENSKLRELLDFTSEYNYKYVPANVVSKENFLSSNNPTFLIDKGSKHGIREGLAVVSEEGLLVGKVMEVKKDSSQIYLSTHTEIKIAASLLKENTTSGIIRGQLGLTIKMEFIPQTSEIEEGDLVVSSGLEKNIPAGLVIGRVNKVESQSNEIWKTANIEPLNKMENLSLVSVILPQ